MKMNKEITKTMISIKNTQLSFVFKLIQHSFIVLLFLLIPTLTYILKDPYKDFGNHEDYRLTYYFHIPGDMTVKRLEKKRQNINTFILGSSRSVPMYSCYIKHKIFKNSKDINPFHFSTWQESIGGIYEKLKYLNRKKYKIKNCIILIDNKNTFKNQGEVIQDNHYILTGKSKFRTYYEHFLQFFYYSGKRLPENIKILCGYKNKNEINYADLETNDLYHKCDLYHQENKMDTSLFFKSIPINHEKYDLYPRKKDSTFSQNQISKVEQNYLIWIKNILKKNKTNYLIIIAPMYNQKKFSIKDQTIISKIFDNRIIDFSGVNSITENQNYYSSTSHYYPIVGKIMIDSISKSKLLYR